MSIGQKKKRKKKILSGGLLGKKMWLVQKKNQKKKIGNQLLSLKAEATGEVRQAYVQLISNQIS